MAHTIELKIPDIGGHAGVPVIEILVAVGDQVEKDQSLLTLESDKATMEIPAEAAGRMVELKLQVGQEVSAGSLIGLLEVAENTAAAESVATAPAAPVAESAPAIAAAVQGTSPAAASSGRKADLECALLVLGSGPGGYSAAFRAADLGLDTVLVECHQKLGGVCLNVGCIPSKALLHAAEVIEQAAALAEHGIRFGKPSIELDRLREFKSSVVDQLTGGLADMAKARKVHVVTGYGRFISPHELEVESAEGTRLIRFQQAIIAAGSKSVKLPTFPWDDPRIIDSTGALALEHVPAKLLVVGGGIIGLEMATVYAALGSEVTVVEFAPQLIPAADADLVKPLAKRLAKRLKGVHINTKVVEARVADAGIEVRFEGESLPETHCYDRVLVAIGRQPNGLAIGAENAGIVVDERGFIPVDSQLRTQVPHIFAIGDIVGQPMLAHKATHEAHVAAQAAAGQRSHFDARVIPSVAFTDPEIAWVGVTEREARQQGLKVGVARFPWAASGRALGIDRAEGFTKLLFDEETHRIVGAGIVGPHAGDLISELALAIEMGAEAADIALTIHPHPTLGETAGLAAEVYEGTVTDLYIPKKKAG